MTVRPMLPSEEEIVRELYGTCHPTWAPKPRFWYFAHPTLVVEDAGGLVGYTSFSVSVSPTGGAFLYGHDVGVREDMRGLGLGLLLHRERLEIGRSVGAKTFMGMTWPENEAMVRILLATGAHACQCVPGAYPHNDPPVDGVVYVGAIGEH